MGRPGRFLSHAALCAGPQDAGGDPENPRAEVLGSSGRGVRRLLRGDFESLWRGSCSCSLCQLNRPKVNKIVEILEKARSCYWPALQNVYMNVMDGERGKRREPLAVGWGGCPPAASSGEGPGSLGSRCPCTRGLPTPSLTAGGVRALVLVPCRPEGGQRHCSVPEASAGPAGGDGAGRLHSGAPARGRPLVGAGLVS